MWTISPYANLQLPETTTVRRSANVDNFTVDNSTFQQAFPQALARLPANVAGSLGCGPFHRVESTAVRPGLISRYPCPYLSRSPG